MLDTLPFDTRLTYYTGTSRGFYASPQRKVMRHLYAGPNYAFCSCKGNRDYSHTYLIARGIVSKGVISSLDNAYVFPLYLYPEGSEQTSALAPSLQPNLKAVLMEQIALRIDLRYTFDSDAPFSNGVGTALTPVDVLDYCYAVLHSPAYRARYREHLKNDFPYIPYPSDLSKFRDLVQLGAKLRALYLLEDFDIDEYITRYPVGGTNKVVRAIRKDDFEVNHADSLNQESRVGRVWINDAQHFDGVPEATWNLYIGGYQPAQKWLKDRQGRTLTFEDIRHYQRIVLALHRIEAVMSEINSVGLP